MFESRLLLSIDDLSDDEIQGVMEASRRFASRGRRKLQERSFSVALLFLSPSLRTHAGFAEAALRLGGMSIDVHELRWGPGMSAGESFADTVRTLTGMADILVTRTKDQLDRGLLEAAAVAPVVNAGDGDGDGEHPTQALVDLLAIEEECGAVGDLHVAICGDLRMRASRSLIKLLNRRPPRALTLMAPPGRDDAGVRLDPELERRTYRRTEITTEGIDVLYMAGLPEGAGTGRLREAARAEFRLTAYRLRRLPREAIILSPLPVIDEIDADVRSDPRVRMFQQSDRGVFVRMAVIDLLLDSCATAQETDTHPLAAPIS